KINAAGNALVYSSYLGGIGLESGNGIAVDSSGNAYVTGATGSFNFPTVNPFQSFFSGFLRNAFVTKVNSTGSALVYSTYLSGSGEGAVGTGITVDSTGNAYVVGEADSTDFPTANPLQANCAVDSFGSCTDAFVSQFDAAGTSLAFSTYLGGSDLDQAFGVAVGSTRAIYVTGRTLSSDFPVANAVQPS